MPDQAEGGDVNAIVARARATGLTHLYVRTGSSVDGFYAAPSSMLSCRSRMPAA